MAKRLPPVHQQCSNELLELLRFHGLGHRTRTPSPVALAMAHPCRATSWMDSPFANWDSDQRCVAAGEWWIIRWVLLKCGLWCDDQFYRWPLPFQGGAFWELKNPCSARALSQVGVNGLVCRNYLRSNAKTFFFELFGKAFELCLRLFFVDGTLLP